MQKRSVGEPMPFRGTEKEASLHFQRKNNSQLKIENEEKMKMNFAAIFSFSNARNQTWIETQS